MFPHLIGNGEDKNQMVLSCHCILNDKHSVNNVSNYIVLFSYFLKHFNCSNK